LSNKTIALDVDSNETVADVKNKVQVKEGYPSLRLKSLKILYNGKHLEDARTIQDCSIEKESVLHLRLSVRSEQYLEVAAGTSCSSASPVSPTETSDSSSSEKSDSVGSKRKRSPKRANNVEDSETLKGCSHSAVRDCMHISVETVNIACPAENLPNYLFCYSRSLCSRRVATWFSTSPRPIQ
jgi:hypothetical protein